MAESMDIRPDESTRAGRMLLASQITLTVVSPRTGHHITVRLRCKLNNKDHQRGPKNWLSVGFAEATHVFAEVPGADGWSDKIGSYYPGSHMFYVDKDADPARVFALREAVAYVNGESTRCEVKEETRCGICGRELTDPISIERGIGPECYGQMTGSKHQSKNGNPTTGSIERGLYDEREPDEIAPQPQSHR